MDSDEDDDAAAVSSVATATAAAEPRVKLESAPVESLPQVKLEAIAVMRGALPKLSESQLWELLSAHGHDATAAIQAHILAQFAIVRQAQPQLSRTAASTSAAPASSTPRASVSKGAERV